jgi:hypothetical protein
MREVQAAAEPEEVRDYVFATQEGTVRLSALFGAKPDLIVIYSMGSSCAYCTLWADGFNGIYNHLASRAAFVVSSPDHPHVQKKFAAGRGFPATPIRRSPRTWGMGRRAEAGDPGITSFRKDVNRILRVSDVANRSGR